MTRIIPALVLGMVEEASSSAHSEVSPTWLQDRVLDLPLGAEPGGPQIATSTLRVEAFFAA